MKNRIHTIALIFFLSLTAFLAGCSEATKAKYTKENILTGALIGAGIPTVLLIVSWLSGGLRQQEKDEEEKRDEEDPKQ